MNILLALNAAVFSIFLYLLYDEGLPRNTFDQLLFIIVLITPVINAMYLLKIKIIDEYSSSNNWITLYFKRKRLEEEKKIADLNGK